MSLKHVKGSIDALGERKLRELIAELATPGSQAEITTILDHIRTGGREQDTAAISAAEILEKKVTGIVGKTKMIPALQEFLEGVGELHRPLAREVFERHELAERFISHPATVLIPLQAEAAKRGMHERIIPEGYEKIAKVALFVHRVVKCLKGQGVLNRTAVRLLDGVPLVLAFRRIMKANPGLKRVFERNPLPEFSPAQAQELAIAIEPEILKRYGKGLQALRGKKAGRPREVRDASKREPPKPRPR